MSSWKTPTPEQIEHAIALLAHPVYQARFFEGLENPKWLDPLNARGFFTVPPDQDGEATFTPWPASGYLARMAVHEPDTVLDILLKMKATNSARVQQDVVNAALALAPSAAAQLVTRDLVWLKGNGPLLLRLPEKLLSLAVRLAQAGEIKTAWRIARAVLTIGRKKSVRELPEEIAGYAVGPSVEPEARFDTWHYVGLVRSEVPALVQASGKLGLLELVKLLSEAVTRATTHGPASEDYLYVGRPAIEVHEQNIPVGLNGPVDALIDAVRDAGIQLVRDGTVPLDEVIALLDKQIWRIFQRIALHILRAFTPQANVLTSAHLADAKLYAAREIFHEYVVLARAAFASLAPDAQEAILRLGDEDKDEHWRTRVFGAFRETIPHAAAEQHPWLADLASEEALVGEADDGKSPFSIDRDFLSTMRSWTGPTSPRSLEDLRGLTVPEIVAEIADWTPTEEMWSPSPEGFARVLENLVRERPDQFAREAERFVDLPATYVGHLLFGFVEATRAQHGLPWEPILRLCAWVVKQRAKSFTQGGSSESAEDVKGELLDHVAPTVSAPRPAGEDSDDWAWARSNVARLIEAAVTAQDTAVEVPFSYFQDIWHLLEVLAEDPNPTPEEDREFADPEDGRSKMGPSGLALNSVRGAAFHAVVRYALWLSNNVSEQDTPPQATDQEERQATGDRPGLGMTDATDHTHLTPIETLHQVLALLARHLDPVVEPSLAVRSVYGQYFPWLVVVDRDWAAAHVSHIFSKSPEHRKLYDAAWETYLTFCQPYRDVFSLLAAEYRRAVQALEPASEAKAFASDQHIAPTPTWRLAEHLILLYLRGTLTLDPRGSAGGGADNSDAGLLADFFAHAPEPIAAHAIEYAGLVFQHTQGELPPETRERAKRLWDTRLAQAATKLEVHRREMSAFGDWYGSGKLDGDWALRSLQDALELSGGAIRSPHLVASQLAAEAETMRSDEVVRLALQCLRQMLFGPAGRLELVSLIESEVRRILAAGHAASAENLRRDADELINRLGGEGIIQFGDILKRK